MSMKQITLLMSVLAIPMCCLCVANADEVLFDNGLGGPANITHGYLSDYDTSSFDVQAFQADDFVLPNSILNGVRWTGFYAFENTPPPSDDFEIAFYEDDGFGAPVLVSFLAFDFTATRDFTGVVSPSGHDVYAHAANFAPIRWTDSSTFWVSIRNRTFDEVDDWFWGADQGVGNSHFMVVPGPWKPTAQARLDFQLIGNAIPEPSSTAILGVCLIGAWIRRRR